MHFKKIYFTLEISLVILCIFLIIWYVYYKYCFNYWKKRGVPFKPPIFPGGNLIDVLLGKSSIYVEIENLHKEFKEKGCIHAGLYFFNGPVYMPISPELIKNVLTNDFEYFMDRGTFYHEKAPLSGHIFSLPGQRWRDLRVKLSPTFTSGKLKTMYHNIFMKNTKTLIKVTNNLANGSDVNIKVVLNDFSADIIAASAFGIESNILVKPDTKFAEIVHKIFQPPLWLIGRSLLEDGFKNPGMIIKSQHVNKEVEEFISNMTLDTIKYREDNGVECNDFLSLLMKARDTFGLSNNDIIAQSFLFLFAGFETTSSSISFCLHELAHNQEIQDRLREEIHGTLGKDFETYTYDDLLKLPYLDKVVEETLRLYPVVGYLNRICVKDYHVPGTNCIIEKGTPVIVSMLGLQRDSEYFPDPLKFDPERFNPGNDIPQYANIPFGAGPRICIGMRYGILQTKLGVATMVSKYKFLPSKKTPKYYQFDKISRSLTLASKHGIWVKMQRV